MAERKSCRRGSPCQRAGRPGSPSRVRAQKPPRWARRRPSSRRGGGGGGGWRGGGRVDRVGHSRGAQTTSQDLAGEARLALGRVWRRQATRTDSARAVRPRCAVGLRHRAHGHPGWRPRNKTALSQPPRSQGPTGHALAPSLPGRLRRRHHATGASAGGGLSAWA